MREKGEGGRREEAGTSSQSVMYIWFLWRSKETKEDLGKKLQPGHWGALEPNLPASGAPGGPVFVSLLCPVIAWEQLMGDRALLHM